MGKKAAILFLKSMQSILLIVLITVFSSNASAQNGNGFEDPYNVNSYGITGYGRRGNLPIEDISKLPKEAQDKIKQETLKKTIAKFQSNLQLDELQSIVISKTITQCLSKQNVLINNSASEELKITEIESLMQNTEREILSFLNEKQKESFQLMIVERKKKFENLKR